MWWCFWRSYRHWWRCWWSFPFWSLHLAWLSSFWCRRYSIASCSSTAHVMNKNLRFCFPYRLRTVIQQIICPFLRFQCRCCAPSQWCWAKSILLALMFSRFTWMNSHFRYRHFCYFVSFAVHSGRKWKLMKKTNNFVEGLFMILMPILLMNLLIGLAVGDIESVRRNAQLKRLAMQVSNNALNIIPSMSCTNALLR